MEDNKSSYKSLIKATSLFGGVQVFNIIISIVKSKIIAVLLGPLGLGVLGLLNSTTALVSALTNFGLRISAIRDIAAANENGNQNRINKIVTVFTRLVWLTGLIGAVFTFIFSPWLSKLTFGNSEYTLAFMWLSSSLLFNQLTSGQHVILQGMRKLSYLAKANVFGSLIGLLISAPLYYYYLIDGIVPSIILTSLFSLIIARYFTKKIRINFIQVTAKETVFEGKGMLKMGIILSISGLITTGASYIVRVFISSSGNIEDVGLYTAGFTIIGTYVGLVFTAMSTDYYPRLSCISHNNKKANLLVNQQAEIAVLILAPILTLFLIFINVVIVLLYSSKFNPVIGLIQWASLGMYFKAASFSIGYLFLAKGASKTFFWSELAANTYLLLFNILGYKYFGLTGMGFSFLIGYIFVLFQVYIIAAYKYKFKFSFTFYKMFSIQLLIGIICFFITMFVSTPWNYVLGIPFILFSSYYSFIILNKEIDIKGFIIAYKDNIRRKKNKK